MKYKALILDIDGTLLIGGEKTNPTEKVTKAIQKASKFVHIGLATARPLFLVSYLLKHLNLSGPTIIDGGARIIDSKSEKILSEHIISTKDLYNVLSILKQIKVPFFIHDNGKDVSFSPDYVPVKPFTIATEKISHDMANKTITHVSPISTIAAHKFNWHIKDTYGVSITHALATKQYGIFEVAKLLGIETKEIIGVGDSYNDFPLLMACGLKVAMGNAIDDLKAIADYVAPSVEEDGVADVIEKFILN